MRSFSGRLRRDQAVRGRTFFFEEANTTRTRYGGVPLVSHEGAPLRWSVLCTESDAPA